jgi:acetyl esterase/lipase
MKRFRIVHWSFLLALSVLAGGLPASEITTGSALDELGAPPPPPPPGFETAAAVTTALQQGKIRVIELPGEDGILEERGVEYGRVGNRPLLLDLYSPAQRQGAVPGIVLIHGGAWKGGRKEDYTIYGRKLAQLGYVVASIGYRLSGEAKFPAALEDCKCAVRWMRANSAKLGVNPDALGVAGGSAGGHLALMVGYTANRPEFEGTGGHAGVSSAVQAVVDIYGPADLTTDFVRNNPFANQVVREFLGKTMDADLPLYQQASPVTYISPQTPPTLILHGTIDDVVPIGQSDLLAEKLTAAKVPFVYDRLPGWPHGMDLAAEVNGRCVWFMDRFFRRYLKGERLRLAE